MKEATAPRTMAPNGPELPAAGVTATRPATMPEQKPRAEALCPLRRSATIQESPAAAVATKVFIIARAAEPLRSEEHTSELQSLQRISYDLFCLKKKKK